jgi:hypothetical protein
MIVPVTLRLAGPSIQAPAGSQVFCYGNETISREARGRVLDRRGANGDKRPRGED